jgi:hypothetical protein
VLYEATATNQEPPSYVGFYSSYSYLPSLGIPIMKEAVQVTATRQDGTPLAVAVESTDNPWVARAVVDLEPDLFYQDSAAIRLTYDLPPMGARSESFTRLNPAFATFPVFAVGDPGQSSVEVVVPERYDVELVGDPLDRTVKDGQQVFRADAIADTEEFEVDVVARDDTALTKRKVELGAHDATVLGWPGDEEWVDFAATQIGKGVPELIDLIGLRWPAKDDLDIVETVSPYLYGYAGWYQPEHSLIEVGDELDQQVILHELSHLWFNDELFASRWVNEGLADVYASRVIAALGGTPDVPEAIDPAATGAVALDVWETPHLQSEDSFAEEHYGYNTSWSVIDQVATEIGMEQLGAVIRAGEARLMPYAADGDARTLPIVATWHQFLDLLENTGGSTTASGLFRAHVAAPSEVGELDARATARAAFTQLQAEGRGWSPPFSVRRAMAMWDFPRATALMEQTRALLPVLDGLEAELADVGLELPASVRVEYERSADPDALRAALEGHLAAVRSFTAAIEARADGRGPVSTVGLAFTRVDLRLAGAHTALAAGDFAGAARTSEDVADQIDDATQAALARTAAVLLLVALAIVVRRRGVHLAPEVAAPMHRALHGARRALPDPHLLWGFVTQRHAVPPDPPRPLPPDARPHAQPLPPPSPPPALGRQ